MNRCKCVQTHSTADGICEFQFEHFYDFDYIPPTGEKLPFYRVYCPEGKTANFDMKGFHSIFKKY
jgi:hypothetical protein